MKIQQRPYTREADLPAILALKQRCTTPQNIYEQPTVSDLRQLLVPLVAQTARTKREQFWQQAPGDLSAQYRQRVLTQYLTALWEDAHGSLQAYALIAQPGRSLTFQVHPQARGQGIEAEILAWGLAQMPLLAQVYGAAGDLWCRCHTGEQERRNILQTTGFQPLFEPDLRLVHPLAHPVPPVSLPQGFSLKPGITQEEMDAYQELHQAVFAGISMNMDDHLSSTYQSDLDMIAVDEHGRFAAFCQCELKHVTDHQGERRVGEVGIIGTRPELQQRGLGRTLLLTGLSRLHERGASSAYLETSQAHGPAQRLFASAGFTCLSTWQWYARAAESA